MSKFKRRQNALKQEKRVKAIEENGERVEKQSTSPDLAANGYRESVVRDCTVLAQMMNDYPHTDDVNKYFAESMGVMLLDLPKGYIAKLLRLTLKHINVPQDKASNIADDVLKTRLLHIRFKD